MLKSLDWDWEIYLNIWLIVFDPPFGSNGETGTNEICSQ